MASQRVIIATFAGKSAMAVSALFDSWRAAQPEEEAIDRLCELIRENSDCLPIVYYCEWIDRWLMGNLIPGRGHLEGRKFQATCLSVSQALALAEECGHQWQEQEWLAARLREAAEGWGSITEQLAVVVIRNVFGSSTTDEDVEASLDRIPIWLPGAENER